ncbi:MAG TPA: LysM peptidoglycan-binding domain-containing protein [Candidatus Limnocylindrales bacterium]|nr:LysM peptidoglycan-binding domain-containing protein [Candidatus Limnocylindrales bacterium]
MTERGLPIVDGAPACPFVAFEDDRDERAASPDHRHRCYAEAQPAPRALAHQEAYCLSSAFPVCPTFQDWARREAARSRGQEPRHPTDAVAAAAMPPQRNPPRNWAEPPPWSSRGGGSRPSGDDDWQDEDAVVGGAAGAAAAGGAAAGAAGNIAEPGRGLSGSYADRVASDAGGEDAPPVPEADDDDTDAPIGAVPPYAPPIAHDLTAPGSDPDEAPPVYEGTGAWADDDGDADADPEPPARRHRERDPERLAALRGQAPRGGGQPGGNRPVRHRDDNAPEWERARPLEAYPTLRSRRLSELSIPPLLVAVVALALAAAVLFALPGLLGFGKPSAGQSSGPSVPVTTPLVTPAPTAVPKPTDQLYVVQSGDTLSGIAKRFKVTLADLIAANAETLPDPNKLSIGDKLIIPAKNPAEVPAAT